MWELVGITEVASSVLLLINKWMGSALIFATIISVNIILCLFFLDSTVVGLALLVAIFNILLV